MNSVLKMVTDINHHDIFQNIYHKSIFKNKKTVMMYFFQVKNVFLGRR